MHNAVFQSGSAYSSIEWRYSNTKVTVNNNLVSHTLLPRDGAAMVQAAGNVEGATAALFLDPAVCDLHLRADAAAALDRGTRLAPGLCDRDIDGDAGGEKPDVGADER